MIRNFIRYGGCHWTEDGRGHGGGRGQKLGKSGDVLHGQPLSRLFDLENEKSLVNIVKKWNKKP